jgi:thioredoxin reductase
VSDSNNASIAPRPAELVDVVVVGGGAAGLSAALVLGRARRSVHVIDAGAPRNRVAEHMHGTLSRDTTSPAEFLAAGRAELARYRVQITSGEVRAVQRAPGEDGRGRWVAHLDDGTRIPARRLVVATGLVDQLPAVPGLAPLWGRDVVSCPYCHGWEVADQHLALLATAPGDLARAVLLTQWSTRVRVFTHQLDPAQFDPALRVTAEAAGIELVTGPVAELVTTRGRLTGIRLADGASYEHPVLFVVPGLEPRAALLTALGAATDAAGWPVVDAAGATSVDGVWAVGNTTDSGHKVIHAAAHGSTAAQAVNEDLLHADLAAAASDI